MEEKQDTVEVAEIIEKEDFEQFAKSERTNREPLDVFLRGFD